MVRQIDPLAVVAVVAEELKAIGPRAADKREEARVGVFAILELIIAALCIDGWIDAAVAFFLSLSSFGTSSGVQSPA